MFIKVTFPHAIVGVNVLLIGSGAREHAIAEAIKRSTKKPRLHCFMSSRNTGMLDCSESSFIGDITNADVITSFAAKVKATIAVIGPEASLAAGVADALLKKGMNVIGPTKKAAQIETSKAFTRNLLEKYNIAANPKYKVFASIKGIDDWLEELQDYVIKADGLRSGKGVKLSGEHLNTNDEALTYAQECIQKDGRVVIEEKFVGQEFSLMSFSDGNVLKHMPLVQDHKRAHENDSGANTGGMGSYSDANHSLPFLSEYDIKEAQQMNEKVVRALQQEIQQPYIGILYGGFIATADGIRLIEYNARFGDPESLNIFSILKTDIIDIFDAMCKGTLDKLQIEFEHKATVCKYIVPEGYPDNPVKNEKIVIPKQLQMQTKLYTAAVDERDNGLYMTGSRAVACVGCADTLQEAEQLAEQLACQIQGKVYHRSDIGTAALLQKRIDQMNSIRKIEQFT